MTPEELTARVLEATGDPGATLTMWWAGLKLHKLDWTHEGCCHTALVGINETILNDRRAEDDFIKAHRFEVDQHNRGFRQPRKSNGG